MGSRFNVPILYGSAPLEIGQETFYAKAIVTVFNINIDAYRGHRTDGSRTGTG